MYAPHLSWNNKSKFLERKAGYVRPRCSIPSILGMRLLSFVDPYRFHGVLSGVTCRRESVGRLNGGFQAAPKTV